MRRQLLTLAALFGALPTAQAFVAVRSSTTTTTRNPASLLALASTTTTASSVELPAGLTKTVLEPGINLPVQRGDIATVKYACYVVDDNEESASSPTPPFCKATRQKMVVSDGSMIPGWEAALKSMRIGERSLFRITDPALGYGTAGVPPLVPPNAILELDVQILDAQPPTANIDFDNLALDSTPTTAADIARAYELRQAAKGNVETAEGWQGWLQKAKNFYFFGLFEGETGERPPWFLRPSITFPLAFAVVGATFYVTFAGGGISERGAQSTDELDELILSSNSNLAAAVYYALAVTQVKLGL